MRTPLAAAMASAVLIALVGVADAAVAAPTTVEPTASPSAERHGAGLAEPAEVVRPAQRPRAYTATAVPDSVDLTQWAVPAGDQGQVGSCTSWSVGYTLTGWWASRAGVPTAFAPMYVYSQTHLSNAPDGGGAYLADAFRITSSQGIDTRAHYSHSGTDFSVTPNAAETANAAAYTMQPMQRLYAGYSGVASSSARQLITSSLAAGKPVVLGIPIYDAFYSLDPSDHRFTSSDVFGGMDGYHAVVVLGYDASGVTIENSWGDRWGDHGFAQLGWDFVAQYSMEADTTAGMVASPPDTGVASWPTAVSTSATPNTATITWQPPVVSGGVPISGYRVTRDGEDLAHSGATTIDVAASTRSFTFSNLYPSWPYTLSVQAITAAAGGETTSLAAMTATATVPSAPTALAVTPDSDGRSMDLDWSPPVDSGGWSVYRYDLVVTGGGTTDSWSTGTTSLRQTLSRVKPGTEYTVAVSAVNATGAGPVATTSFTTPDVPSAPTVTGTTSTTTTATVSWAAGGGVVTGYRLSSPSIGVVTLPADARTYTMTDLSGGTTYSVSVAAVNAAGASAPAVATVVTAPWPTVVQLFSPTAVRDLRVDAALDGTATVSWRPPSSTGGAPLRDVHVRWIEQDASGTPWAYDTVVLPGDATTATIGKHPAGRVLHVDVWTTNTAGMQSTGISAEASVPVRPTSAPSDPATPSNPGRPASVAARWIGSAVIVRWTAPVDDGGSEVLRWKVSVGSAVVWVRDPGARTATVRDVRAGASVSVVAVNAVGAGTPATASGTAPALAAPARPKATSAAHAVVLRWAPPKSAGARVTGYRITRSGVDPRGHRFTSRTLAVDARSFVFGGLRRHRAYTITIRAMSGAEPGPPVVVHVRTR